MEDTPEQILARLERYRASLGSGAVAVSRLPARESQLEPLAPARPARPAPAAGSVYDIERRRVRLNPVEITLLGQLLAALAGVIGVLSFERFATTTAVVVVAAMTGVGVAAASRRVPMSMWWTVGAVLGGILGRWS